MQSAGHNIKWENFEILEREKTDKHCLIKERLLIKQLLPIRTWGVKSIILISLYFIAGVNFHNCYFGSQAFTSVTSVCFIGF